MSIDFRDLNLADLRVIETFSNPSYGLPSLGNDLNFVSKTILVDGRIVGSAVAHLTSEVSLILDNELSKLQKAKILKDVFEIMLKEITAAGLEDTHVFILPESDKPYELFLMKHFNFVKATGRAMYLHP